MAAIPLNCKFRLLELYIKLSSLSDLDQINNIWKNLSKNNVNIELQWGPN